MIGLFNSLIIEEEFVNFNGEIYDLFGLFWIFEVLFDEILNDFDKSKVLLVGAGNNGISGGKGVRNY